MVLVDFMAIFTAGIGGLLVFLAMRKKSPILALVALDGFIFMIYFDCMAMICWLLSIVAVFCGVVFHASKSDNDIILRVTAFLPWAFLSIELIIIFIRAVGVYLRHYLQYPIPGMRIREKIKRFVITQLAFDELTGLMRLSIQNALELQSNIVEDNGKDGPANY